MGEVAFTGGRWAGGNNLGFAIEADSNLMYGLKVGNILIVGYTNGEGNLSEAFWDMANPGWKTYTL